jgi:hypothetical protein
MAENVLARTTPDRFRKNGVTFGRQRVFAEFYDTSIRAGAPNWTWPAHWTGT